MKKNDKKTTFITRMCMTSLTILLIILFFGIMIMVGRIQGTARVVNYAGLIRGGTQRLVKLENTGQPQDQIIETISSYINGLRNGSDELNFVKLDDAAFQEKMTELDAYFQELKSEIILVREKGYENTDIIEKSEHFFNICDEATGLAEAYSQKLATSLNRLEKIVILDIIALVILIAFELIKALHYAAQNRLLQKKVYLDEATGLPNKNKCEEILNQQHPPPFAYLILITCAPSITILDTTEGMPTSAPLQSSCASPSLLNILSAEMAEMNLSLYLPVWIMTAFRAV